VLDGLALLLPHTSSATTDILEWVSQEIRATSAPPRALDEHTTERRESLSWVDNPP
jgi:hypothetical protein